VYFSAVIGHPEALHPLVDQPLLLLLLKVEDLDRAAVVALGVALQEQHLVALDPTDRHVARRAQGEGRRALGQALQHDLGGHDV
jgi:hypothetical protein